MFKKTRQNLNQNSLYRLDLQIPPAPITCLTHQNTSYMVGEKVYVWFSEDDRMILHINSINSPCWISGTVYFEDGSCSFSYITDVSFFTADLLNGRMAYP